MIFKTDPAAALDKTRQKLSNVEDNIASLRAKRAEVLLTAEDAAAVVTIDKAIEAELANAAIYRDRIKALQEEVRKDEYASREAKRKQAIGKIAVALKKREQIASELQRAIEQVGELYTALVERDEVEQHWGFRHPRGGFVIDVHGIRREVGFLFHGLVHQFGLPAPSSAGLGVTGISAQGVAGIVRQQNESLLSRLEVMPIGNDLLDEAI